MMKYIVYLNSSIAMSKGIVADGNEIVLKSIYDAYVEVTQQQWSNLKIPSKLVEGAWVEVTNSDEMPNLVESSSELSTSHFTVQERLEALEAAMLEMALGE